jgi:xylulose-5-phosphate/fructose-6-phosphate phosphoketolase
MDAPTSVRSEAPSVLDQRDVMRRNMSTFRLFSPDENASNRLQDVYVASLKTWMARIIPDDGDGTDIAPDGRLMEILSEHTLEG